jgi:cation-transporting ATPase E
MAALLICATLLNELFAMNRMSSACVMLFLVFAFAAESLFRLLSRAVEYAEKKIKKKS